MYRHLYFILHDEIGSGKNPIGWLLGTDVDEDGWTQKQKRRRHTTQLICVPLEQKQREHLQSSHELNTG
jgi:hypothetical protein